MININEVKLNDFYIGGSKLVIMAGPCVIEEDTNMMLKTAEKLKEITSELDIPFVYKASYDKANRTSIGSYRGIGIDEGLKLLASIKKEFNVPIITDIHSVEEASCAAML